MLWGPEVASCAVHQRKWTQYIGVSEQLIAHDPACAKHAAEQVLT